MIADRNAARSALEALFTAEDNLTKAQQNQTAAENSHQEARESLLQQLGTLQK